MAISFDRIPSVAVGDRITSTQRNALANGFNQRLRAGLGDPTYRIFFYLLSAFRQVRNPDVDGLTFPSQAEFFEIYQFIEPGDANWPDADPGDFTGANVSSVLNSFVFGSDAAGVAPEADRLTNPSSGGINLLLDGDVTAVTPSQLWELGKRQRGAYDPATGELGAPAFTAARSFYSLIQSPVSPHNNAWGGFMPIPEILGDCGDATADTAAHTDYKIFFTKLNPDAPCPAGATSVGDTCEYPGTCPEVPGDVLSVFEFAGAFYVFLVGGGLDILPSTDFIQGPYQGGATLRKTYGNHLLRFLNAWLREYRGNETQRERTDYHLENSFPFQEFLTSQYHLAPNVGTASGGFAAPGYPLFKFSGGTLLVSGSNASHIQTSGDNYAYGPGTVLTGFLAKASKLAGSVSIAAYDGTTQIASVMLDADEDGNAEELFFLPTAITPAALNFKLSTTANFTDASGFIDCECTQLLEYKPELHDLYLVLRAASTVWNRPTDGIGTEEDSAKEIGDAYFANGCIQNYRGQNGLPGNGPEVNSNGVYDAARRLSMFTRCVRRQNLIAYAVEDGKSVLWFSRYAFGLHNETPADIFQGIAPNRTEIESGDIKAGRPYEVIEGTIAYNSQNLTQGDTFTGLDGIEDFTGGGSIKETEGIRATAGAKDESNEWLVGVQFKAYHTSESSLWKPDSYSDYFALSNRCLFYSHEVEVKPDLVWQFGAGQTIGHAGSGDDYGNDLILAPEGPSGYNYVHGINGPGVPGSTPNFYKSCQIYAPDYEIESATVEEGDGGDEIVKLVFKTRFHSHATAPASIDRDSSTWNVTDLEAEDYRTVENGIRQYIVWATTGQNLSHKEGDSGRLSAVWTLPDNPFATVFPHFIFTKLVPTVYEDGNDTQQEHDTLVTHDVMTQQELYLRAMCEGCVDGLTSRQYACDSGFFALYDYTFENICFEAFDGRWIQTLRTNQREDTPQGFSAIPNTEISAEQYNQLASCVNLMNRFRVQLPMQIQCRALNYATEQEVRLNDPDGDDGGDCTFGETHTYYSGGVPNPSTALAPGAWGNCAAAIGATQSAEISSAACAGSGNWILVAQRADSEFTVSPLDPDAYEAIPEAWRDMIGVNFSVLASKITVTQSYTLHKEALAVNGEACNASAGFWHRTSDGMYLKFDTSSSSTTECVLLGNETITAPSLGQVVMMAGRDAALNSCFSGPVNSMTYLPIVGETYFVEIPVS